MSGVADRLLTDTSALREDHKARSSGARDKGDRVRCQIRSGQNALKPDLLRRGPNRGLAGSIGIRDPPVAWILATGRTSPIVRPDRAA